MPEAPSPLAETVTSPAALADHLEGLARRLRSGEVTIDVARVARGFRRVPETGEFFPSGTLNAELRLVDVAARAACDQRRAEHRLGPGRPYPSCPPMDLDDDEMTGRQEWSVGRTTLFRKDPFSAGAAKVLKRGDDISSITREERWRFRTAFESAFASIPESCFSNLTNTIRQLFADVVPDDAYAPESVLKY